MKKFTLLGAAFMMLVPGILYLVAPQFMLNAPQIELKTVNEFHAFRAGYGGAFLGLAALFALGAFDWSMERASLKAIFLVLLGFAIGRILSIAIDGMPAPLYIGVLCAELFFAACSAYVLRREV